MGVPYTNRQTRLRALDALEQRAKQFRSYEAIWPFRIPHAPLSLDDLLDEALAGDDARFPAEALKSRTVLHLAFAPEQAGDAEHVWEAWVVALPSGVMLYCDNSGEERHVLASVKRGSAIEADGFFLELLAETHGHAFEIEMSAAVPDRVRTSVADRGFLVDVFVELFEGTAAESALRHAPGGDFRADVDRWLDRVWTPPTSARPARRQPRRRDEMP